MVLGHSISLSCDLRRKCEYRFVLVVVWLTAPWVVRVLMVCCFFSKRICACIAVPFLPFWPILQTETRPSSPETFVWSLIWICEDPPVVGEQTEGVSFTFISYHSCFAHLCFKGLRNLRWWGHAISHFCGYH